MSKYDAQITIKITTQTLNSIDELCRQWSNDNIKVDRSNVIRKLLNEQLEVYKGPSNDN